jgi:glucan phosphorylase
MFLWKSTLTKVLEWYTNKENARIRKSLFICFTNYKNIIAVVYLQFHNLDESLVRIFETLSSFIEAE